MAGLAIGCRETLRRIAPSRSQSPARVPEPRFVTGRLLALQRTAGNRAVGRTLQRQQTRPAGFDTKKDDVVNARLIMGDPIGVLPLVGIGPLSDADTHGIL